MGSKQKEISEFIVKIISIVVCIALFGSTYWARKNIGRVDKIEAAEAEYSQSLYCIEERYDRNIEYLKEADSLEKKIESGTFTGNIKEAKSLITENRELAPVLVRSSNRCIEKAEEYEKKNKIKVSEDKVKLRKKIKNNK